MTNRTRLLTALALGALLPLSAGASDKAPAAADAQGAETAKPKKVEIRCESTASRIRRNKIEDCAKSLQPTTNYYRHDLERSGETDMNKVLSNLDPRFH